MEFNDLDFDFSSLLIKRYNIYKLTDLEAMLILVGDKILSRGEKILLTRDILSKHMASTKDDIDSALSDLIKKGVIEIINENNQLYSSLDKFKKKVFNDLIKDIRLNKEGNIMSTPSLYTYIEQLNTRPLSAIERDYISNWLKASVDEKSIKEACIKSKTSAGYISFKKADSLILEFQRSLSRKEVGTSTIDEKRDKNNSDLFSDNWLKDDK